MAGTGSHFVAWRTGIFPNWMASSKAGHRVSRLPGIASMGARSEGLQGTARSARGSPFSRLAAGLRKAWLVIPLLWHDNLSGFVVLAKSMSQPGMDWEINDLLKTAARQAAAHLAQAQAAEALTVARQFESFNRAAAFVVHDIKNLVAHFRCCWPTPRSTNTSRNFRKTCWRPSKARSRA
jgi:hypothetical protein